MARYLGRTLHSCLLIAAICLAMPVTARAQETVRFNDDGFVYIDGQPRLVIGMYECPTEDALLDQLAANGFNLVCGSADKAQLDRIQAHNLHAWIPLGGALSVAEGDTAAREKLAGVVNAFKDHPALLAWEAPDESLWMEWFASYQWLTVDQPAQLMALIQKAGETRTAEEVSKYGALLAKAVDYSYRSMWKESEVLYDTLWNDLGSGNPHPELHVSARIEAARVLGDNLTRGWECVWSQDKTHVFWQNHAPGNSIQDLRHFNRAVYAAGCDIYPAPWNTGVEHGSTYPNMDITNVGAFTRYMREGAPGKACWMVLQGFGWKDLKDAFNPSDEVRGRRPNYQETRFMAYEALLNGADAILYWGTYKVEKDSALWGDIMKVAKELRALEAAFVGLKTPFEPVAIGEPNYTTFNGGDPKLMLRQVDGDWVLIAMNEQRVGVAFQLGGLPPSLNGKTLYRLYSDEEHVVENGGFRDGIPKQNVFVYATSRRFEAK